MENSSESHSPVCPCTPILTSSVDLCFPTPAVDARVTTWVQNISDKNMASSGHSPREDGILGGSAYEFIDTDEESRGDYTTESIASTDGHNDDITSLLSNEYSGEDSDQENVEESRHSALLYRSVEKVFNPLMISSSSHDFVDEIDQLITPAIEFEESFDSGSGPISVKHTIAELDEKQSANILNRITLQAPPQGMVLTIRQTMTKRSLSTKEPLRILYVGSHSAKQDIIHKIAGSVTTSVEFGNEQKMHCPGSQIFNVVPVSAFGSERAPEIELMHSSRYQIKVDTCNFAQNLESEYNLDNHDVIEISLDDNNFQCRSVPLGEKCFTIEPHWELPHITVFYCSDSDNMQIRGTRAITKNFMNRHSIPSIFISHRLSFDRNPCLSLDQHPIHICLESRDPGENGSIIYQRLPINLASFLSVDARQMNRNLAYLTGLYETLDSVAPAGKYTSCEAQDLNKNELDLKKAVLLTNNQYSFILNLAFSLRFWLMGILIMLLVIMPSYKTASRPSISINNKIVSATSAFLPTTNYSMSSATILATSSISTLPKNPIEGTSTNRNMSFCPKILSGSSIGGLSTGKHSQKKRSSTESLACTAEVYGDKEVLIRISGNTKFSWSKDESISVKITRDNVTIDTDKAYGSEEGITLLLSKKEAYGIVNVSIITRKMPRLNQTFMLDFGSSASQFWQAVKNKMFALIRRDPRIDSRYFTQLRDTANEVTGNVFSESQVTFFRMSDFFNNTRDQLLSVSDTLTDSAKAFSLEAIKHSAIISKEASIHVFEAKNVISNLRRPLDKRIFLAQVRSKILWLQMQQMQEEAKNYKKKAVATMRNYAQREEKCIRYRNLGKESKYCS